MKYLASASSPQGGSCAKAVAPSVAHVDFMYLLKLVTKLHNPVSIQELMRISELTQAHFGSRVYK